jgi:hypothetical protein
MTSTASSAPVASIPRSVTGSALPSGERDRAAALVTTEVAMRSRLPIAPARRTPGAGLGRRSVPGVTWNRETRRKKGRRQIFPRSARA